jgi:hypothetical protein
VFSASCAASSRKKGHNTLYKSWTIPNHPKQKETKTLEVRTKWILNAKDIKLLAELDGKPCIFYTKLKN